MRVQCLPLELHRGWAADNNVHTTTAVASSQNINSDSCSNFYVVDDAQIIKQRKITTLKVWRGRKYSQHYFVRAYFSTNGAGAAGVAKDFQLNAAKFRSSVQERQLSTRTSKQPVQNTDIRYLHIRNRAAHAKPSAAMLQLLTP